MFSECSWIVLRKFVSAIPISLYLSARMQTDSDVSPSLTAARERLQELYRRAQEEADVDAAFLIILTVDGHRPSLLMPFSANPLIGA